MTDQPTTLTVKELRRLLFHIDNQEMTVRELRNKLFEVKDQQAPVKDQHGIFKQLGIE